MKSFPEVGTLVSVPAKLVDSGLNPGPQQGTILTEPNKRGYVRVRLDIGRDLTVHPDDLEDV